LAATVAHELNNPLGGILNYAKLTSRTLREHDAASPVVREADGYLHLIQKEADRCGVIVRNLLTFARPNGSEMGPHAASSIVARALMLVRHHLEISGVRLETPPVEGDDRIVCDADQIHQALVALFVNAVEAMVSGGTLRVSVRGGDAHVEISITDTGMGIPPDAMEHIFEPFYSTKDRQEGVGLGLPVVYGIVRRHGGTIAVTSEVHRGSTFTLTLPRRQAAAGGPGRDEEARAAEESARKGVA
ncbi:MAG TPA: HAMP domain-containing sensor histidine kinase, partial [Acidobacteriota bacterium]|nr:HAMP domain-containing sensor histidine kinase [Acidobacteriota bacterium]